MLHWQEDFNRTELEIVAIPAGHTIYPARVEDWELYLKRWGTLPSILLTKDGWIVNGHHRLIVAQKNNVRLHGLIVEHNGTGWTATGNLCLVLPPRSID